MADSLSHAGVNDLKMLCGQFVKRFDARYFKFDIGRVSVCKSTIQALLHLGRAIELCGPLVNVNQSWVERFIGTVKHRLHARRLAAEALTENAKFWKRTRCTKRNTLESVRKQKGTAFPKEARSYQKFAFSLWLSTKPCRRRFI